MEIFLSRYMGIVLFSMFIYLVFALIFFLLLRGVILWYFKINENTRNLSRIANALERISTSDYFEVSKHEKSDLVNLVDKKIRREIA